MTQKQLSWTYLSGAGSEDVSGRFSFLSVTKKQWMMPRYQSFSDNASEANLGEFVNHFNFALRCFPTRRFETTSLTATKTATTQALASFLRFILWRINYRHTQNEFYRKTALVSHFPELEKKERSASESHKNCEDHMLETLVMTMHRRVLFKTLLSWSEKKKPSRKARRRGVQLCPSSKRQDSDF